MEEEEEDRYFPRCHSRVLRMDAHTHTHTHKHIYFHRDETQRRCLLKSLTFVFTCVFFTTHRYSPRCDSAELRLEKFYPDQSWELSDSNLRDRCAYVCVCVGNGHVCICFVLFYGCVLYHLFARQVCLCVCVCVLYCLCVCVLYCLCVFFVLFMCVLFLLFV